MAQTIPMGIGRLGSRDLVFKRKFRFTLELEDICGNKRVPMHYVKTAARPNISIEPTQIDFLNGRAWIPGKASWETITVTYYDVATSDVKPLYDWLATVYNFTDNINLQMGSQRQDYSARAVLKLWDGCGQLLETWVYHDAWPEAINFGDLDYSTADIVTIDLTLRYSDVTYTSECPKFEIDPCCSPCPSVTGPSDIGDPDEGFAGGFV